jgi:hypothetical protein
LPRGRAPGREFDIAFWQALGPRRILEAGVRYLVVGGYAVVHTEPRYTKDLDLCEPVESKARKLFAALAEFGAPIQDIQPGDLTEPEVFFQIGMEPVRVDIMTSVSILDFDPAWERRVMVDFGGEPAPVLCRADLPASKLPRTYAGFPIALRLSLVGSGDPPQA